MVGWDQQPLDMFETGHGKSPKRYREIHAACRTRYLLVRHAVSTDEKYIAYLSMVRLGS